MIGKATDPHTRRPQIAILASGEGTTAESVIRADIEGKINAQVGLIICNNPDAGVFKRITRLNEQYGLSIKVIHVSKLNYPAKSGEELRLGDQTEAEELAILKVLTDGRFDLIVSMGYLKRNGRRLVNTFGWRNEYSDPHQAMLLNTHPGLLPDTRGRYGLGVQQYVLEKRLPYAGQTLHVAAINYDEGPVIVEHRIPVHENETPEALFARVQALEKKYLPGDIDEFIKNRHNYFMKAQNGS